MVINTVQRVLATRSSKIKVLMKIEIYQANNKSEWDDFVRTSRNGHFLFYRDYMDYHKDRFKDSSLIVRNDKNEIVTLLPAHHIDQQFCSHLGLTYGGFIVDEKMKTALMLDVFDHTITFLKQHSYTSFIYKTMPYIHHTFPSDEDRYALFRMNARLFRRNAFSVITQQDRIPFQERRRRCIKKAQQNNLVVSISNDYKSFWSILNEVLSVNHQVKPVHDLSEIQLLSSKFPDHIHLYGCFMNDVMIAGVVVYETKNVVRTQYIAANNEGKELGALDLIFDTLINSIYKNKKYIDFGPSDEKNGMYLNTGLIEQKEGFGARTVVHDHYEVIF